MYVVVIAVLLALVVVTAPSAWAARRPVNRAPQARALAALALAWLRRPVRPRGGVVEELARRLVAESVRLGRRVPGDPRLVLPNHVDVLAHPADFPLLTAHREVVEAMLASVVRHELGFLCVPVKVRVVGLEKDDALIAGRPRVHEASGMSIEVVQERTRGPVLPLPRPRSPQATRAVRTKVVGQPTEPVAGARTVVLRDGHHS